MGLAGFFGDTSIGFESVCYFSDFCRAEYWKLTDSWQVPDVGVHNASIIACVLVFPKDPGKPGDKQTRI